jgi:hypothetical protein
MPSAGFEPAIPLSECLQTHAWDRVATEIGIRTNYYYFAITFMQGIYNYIPETKGL